MLGLGVGRGEKDPHLLLSQRGRRESQHADPAGPPPSLLSPAHSFAEQTLNESKYLQKTKSSRLSFCKLGRKPKA